MQNYRVEVQNHSEAMEAQELFFGMGYRKGACRDSKYPKLIVTDNCDDDWYSSGAMIDYNNECKQITIQELRDMVVLKRNDVNDANYEAIGTNFYKGANWYKWDASIGKWIEYVGSYTNLLDSVKPIQKEEVKMKEYLVKTDSGYVMQFPSDVIDGHNGVIQVPEGAMSYRECDRTSVNFFLKLEGGCHFYHYLNKNSEWVLWDDADFKTFEMKWQRESLNDQVASAEQARQEQIQCKCSTKELHESDLVNDGQKVVDSLVVGLAKQNSQESKVLIPSIHGKVRSNPDLYGLKSTGFSEGGFIPKQNHGAPVGLLHHGFSGFTQPEELPFVDDEPKLRNIKIRVNGNFDKAIETIQSMGYWNCNFNNIPRNCYWLLGNKDASVDYGSMKYLRDDEDYVEYFVEDEPKGVDATLAEREAQYGSFIGVANTTGQLMSVLLNSKNGQTLPYAHQEALHMICSKMARIVNGDHNHLDSWHDIGGYAKLIENNIK